MHDEHAARGRGSAISLFIGPAISATPRGRPLAPVIVPHIDHHQGGFRGLPGERFFADREFGRHAFRRIVFWWRTRARAIRAGQSFRPQRPLTSVWQQNTQEQVKHQPHTLRVHSSSGFSVDGLSELAAGTAELSEVTCKSACEPAIAITPCTKLPSVYRAVPFAVATFTHRVKVVDDSHLPEVAGFFQVVEELITLGVDVRVGVVGDLPVVSAQSPTLLS